MGAVTPPQEVVFDREMALAEQCPDDIDDGPEVPGMMCVPLSSMACPSYLVTIMTMVGIVVVSRSIHHACMGLNNGGTYQ